MELKSQHKYFIKLFLSFNSEICVWYLGGVSRGEL